jgi:cellobiose phosphorylase
MIANQRKSEADKQVKYHHQCITEDKSLLKVNISGSSDDSLMFPSATEISPFDGYPPSLFVQSISPESIMNLGYTHVEDKSVDLRAVASFLLKPNEETTFQLVIGYSFVKDVESIKALSRVLRNDYEAVQNPFARKWQKVLPSFPKEKDPELADEMVWHAYTLEAMATYNEFYGETKIHQGTAYVFDWGVLASARDDFQHALPLCYYNPDLAKSVLRYMRKRTTPLGEIRLIETGYGVATPWEFNTSDQQLYYFLLLTEYLRITNDFDFLLQKAECYPVTDMPHYNGIDTMEQCFRYLRDEVRLGSHGLVRLLNSDWNDAVYFEIKEPYMSVAGFGESHMNTTMALSIFSRLLPLLAKIENDPRFVAYGQRLKNLHQSISLYRTNLLSAFETDLGDRSFSRRMYFAGKTFGNENMFLEPQGFMLQIPEISKVKKLRLYDEMKKRLYAGEKLGAREQQSPEFDVQSKGSRENGGFWYSLNGPVIIGMASVDKTEANKILRKMSFTNYAKSFPNYWTSYWSSADNVESSLLNSEGLTDRSGNYWQQPVYCSHPHAWLLYCYYFLGE